MTVSEHDQERLQALESELSNTKAELARVAREQALAAESLRASEELKSRLIACSRDCIKILDLEGRLLFMNEGGMQVLEICDISPFLNGCWVEFWEGADREAAQAAVRAAQDGGIGRFVGYFETRTSRQPRWWDVVVSPIYDANGKPERLLALSRDVTEHKKNEIALCEAIHFNREIIEGAAEGIIVYDSELRYQLFNPFMERLTGKRSQEVLGRVATEVFPRLGPSGIEASLEACAARRSCSGSRRFGTQAFCGRARSVGVLHLCSPSRRSREGDRCNWSGPRRHREAPCGRDFPLHRRRYGFCNRKRFLSFTGAPSGHRTSRSLRIHNRL